MRSRACPTGAARSRSTCPETLPRVDVDAALLERAVANVVANALAWSPAGAPVRACRAPRRRAASSSGWSIAARGSPPEDRERVFEPFQRLGDRSSARRGGSGPRGRARIRRGDGWRAPDRGHARRRADDGDLGLRGGAMTRVLVVDDEPQILRGLETNLRARGYEVDTAPDGETRPASSRRTAVPTSRSSTWACPGIDGIDVIRGDPGLERHADHRAVGPRPGARQGAGARRRRRRLRHQAVRDGRAARPAARGRAAPAPQRARRPSSRPTRSRWTSPPRGSRTPTGTVASHAHRVAPGGDPACATRASSSVSGSSCRRSGVRSTRTRRTTCGCTWRRSGASSSPTPRDLGTSSPSRAWATGSPRNHERTIMTAPTPRPMHAADRPRAFLPRLGAAGGGVPVGVGRDGCHRAILLPFRDDVDPGQRGVRVPGARGAHGRIGGLGPGIVASVLGFAGFNYFFIPPFDTFADRQGRGRRGAVRLPRSVGADLRACRAQPTRGPRPRRRGHASCGCSRTSRRALVEPRPGAGSLRPWCCGLVVSRFGFADGGACSSSRAPISAGLEEVDRRRTPSAATIRDDGRGRRGAAPVNVGRRNLGLLVLRGDRAPLDPGGAPHPRGVRQSAGACCWSATGCCGRRSEPAERLDDAAGAVDRVARHAAGHAGAHDGVAQRRAPTGRSRARGPRRRPTRTVSGCGITTWPSRRIADDGGVGGQPQFVDRLARPRASLRAGSSPRSRPDRPPGGSAEPGRRR